MGRNHLGIELASRLAEATLLKTGDVALDNARANLPHLRKPIEDVVALPEGDAAVVISAGPSLARRNPVELLKRSGFRGTTIAVDGSLGFCLRNDFVPDWVVCLDPHPYRILRWFGDPDLDKRPADDYFGRQEFDREHAIDEIRANRKLLDLVDRNGHAIRVALATGVAPEVTERCLAAGMEIYWWNPLHDDPDAEGSLSRRVFELNRVPCMVAGGNCGTAAWIFAHAVLGAKRVALTGMDLGYAPGTPLERTEYYPELVELLGDRAREALIDIHNPHLGETWISDPTFYWFREVFIELSRDAACRTFNCTEGGTLFHESIPFVPLAEFLDLVMDR